MTEVWESVVYNSSTRDFFWGSSKHKYTRYIDYYFSLCHINANFALLLHRY